jgi:hypothetical protein
LRFVSAVDGRAEGITELWLTPDLEGLPDGDGPVAEIGGSVCNRRSGQEASGPPRGMLIMSRVLLFM